MRVTLVAAVLLAACARPAPVPAPPPAEIGVERGTFVVTLGRDTVSAEQFERTGNRVTGRIVRRIPRTVVVTYAITLSPAGQPRVLEYRTRMPDGGLVPNGSQSIAVTYRGDSAITELRREPPVRRAAAAPHAFPDLDGSVLSFWLPVNALRATGADSMTFVSHEPGSTTSTNTAVARRDDRRYWVYYFGFPMEVEVDEQGGMQSIDGSRTTFRIAATRQPEFDLGGIVSSFVERERTAGPVIALSPPDSVFAQVGAARLEVRYGRPSARGRAIWSERGVLGDTLWRTGANASTRLVTSADISFGAQRLPAGTYVVTTLAIPDRYQLILSADGREALRVPLTARALPQRVEQFTIRIEPTGAGAGRIALQWDDRELAAAFTVPAQQHAHPEPERLGAVHFPTSCAPAVAPRFDRATALLHSFEFGAAIRGYGDVLAADSSCAMAWWGIALSEWANPMTPNIRPAAVLERGVRAAQAAARLAPRASERERGYIAAVAELYAGAPDRTQRERVRAYERAMSALAARHPSDNEAKIFHAIAIVQAASPGDKTYADQLRAGAILEQLFAAHPDHPGLAHYIIHSYDVPALAGRAAGAARRYADIAPSAAHALHMPSHTFTRVGLWKESVATNQRSFDAALRASCLAEALHAADYAVYGNLQLRQDSATRALLAQLPPIAARFDPTVICGAAPGFAGLFALAAMPARYALERRAWAEAAALEPRTTAFAFTDAVTWFARALGAARLGDTTHVRVARDSLAAMRARLAAAGEGYWAEQVAIQHLGAEAWLLFASNRREDALAKMREAATREDRTEKPAVSPGPLAPARELLADMLAEMGRSAEARVEYELALEREPGRYWSRVGAGRAGSR